MRRRGGAFSTKPSANANTRISIPSCHPAASRSLTAFATGTTFVINHEKVRVVYGAIAAHSSWNLGSRELHARCCAKATKLAV
jgi:hypothetical protein